MIYSKKTKCLSLSLSGTRSGSRSRSGSWSRSWTGSKSWSGKGNL